jgi:hypothetical protein
LAQLVRLVTQNKTLLYDQDHSAKRHLNSWE